MHTFNLEGSDIKYKNVGAGINSSSRVNLPKSWKGKDVAVVLLKEGKKKRFVCEDCGFEKDFNEELGEIMVCEKCGEDMYPDKR